MACVSISSQFKGAILKNQSSLTQDHKNVKPVHGLSFRPKATLHTVWYIAMLFSWRCPFNAFLYKSCTSPPYNNKISISKNSLSSLTIDLFNSIFFSFIYFFFWSAEILVSKPVCHLLYAYSAVKESVTLFSCLHTWGAYGTIVLLGCYKKNSVKKLLHANICKKNTRNPRGKTVSDADTLLSYIKELN